MSLYDVLGQVAQIWDSLSTNEKDYYLNQQAGANQTQNLAAILSNYETALRATETALNANGSAMRQNAVYMESLEAKSNQLKATFQDLANNIVSKDLVSGALTSLNSILEVLDTTAGRFIATTVLLTGALGGLGSLIMLYLRSFGTIGAITGALTGKLWLVVAAIGALVAGIIALRKSFQENSIEGLTAQVDDLNGKLKTNTERLAEINNMKWNDLTPDIIEEQRALEIENAELERNLELKQAALAKASSKSFEEQKIGIPSTNGQKYRVSKETEFKDFTNYKEALKYAEGDVSQVRKIAEAYLAGEEAVTALVKAIGIYNNELKENGELSNDSIIGYDKTIKLLKEKRTEMANMTSAYKLGLEGGKDYTEQIKEIDEVLRITNQLYAQSINPLATRIQQLKDEATQAKLTGQAYTDYLIKGIIDFNNSNVSVTDKIKAIKNLGEAALEAAKDVFLTSYLVANLGENYKNFTPETIARWTGRGMMQWNEALKAAGVGTNSGNTGSDNGSGSGGGGGGTTKDTWKEAAEKELGLAKAKFEAVEAQYGAGKISSEEYFKAHQDYIDEMTRINEKYYKDRSKYEQEYWELVADIYEEQEDLTDNLAKHNEELIKKYKEEVKLLKEQLETEKEEMEQVAAYMQDYAQQQIDAIDAQIEALNEENDALDDQIKKEELLKNLAEAKQKRKYVFKDGRFQYVEDVEAISEAQSAIDEYEREQEVERKKKALEDEKKQWEEYKNGWSNLSNSYDIEQGKLLALEKYGVQAEAKNWNSRLIQLEAFVNQYNKLLSNINYLDAEGNITSVDQIKTITTTTSTKKSGHATAEDILAGKLEGVHLDLSKLEGHAQGTISASGGLTLVGEHGAELVNLPTGAGVIPADITRNLWNFGRNLSNGNVNKSVAISVGNISLPNVKDALGFVNGLKNLAWQYSTQRG